MGNKKRILKLSLLIIIVVTLLGNVAYANMADFQQYQQGLQDPTENPDSWKPTIGAETELAEKAGTVLGIINVIGIVCSIIFLIILGIKYMLGSVEEKAEYKKAIIPYIVGFFLLVSATTLPNLIYIIITGLKTTF